MLNDLLNLSYVPRWCVVNMFREQSVAEHSYRVACIINGLVTMLDKYGITIAEETRRDALDYALVHDATESYTGDVPSPFKDAVGHSLVNNATQKFCDWMDDTYATPDAKSLVKIADQIEGWTWWKRHGDPSLTHPWITPEGPISLNERTMVEACCKYHLGINPVILVRVALTLCHIITGGTDGPATQIAIEIKTNNYLKKH